ncbi:MAG TPA: sugar phosphate isomerase/epimerase [Verrucomicrobiae bacterium]|jgi:sugar phosphate isomerase/epimerase
MSYRKLILAGVLCALTAAQLSAMDIPPQYDTGGFALGCQAYTFNHYSAFEAIDKTVEAGGKMIEFYPGQKLSADRPGAKLDHNMSDEDLAALKAKLAQAGIIAVNYGVVGGRDEAEWRKIFEFAKKLNLYGITTESVNQLDMIEKLVKEYDIRVGIHEHQRRENDPRYKVWDPKYVLSVVKDRDPRIGACADTGHWVTSGLDPLESIKLLKGRVMSCHLKDKDVSGESGHCVPFGTGVGKVKEILEELKAQGFKGNISIEYEYNWTHSVPDVKQCIDFVREQGAH